MRRPANVRSCRARACVARRPANSRYALILLQRHEKSANRALHNALRCVAFASTLVATQRGARVDSHSIFAFLRLAPRIRQRLLIRKFRVSHINATQGLASYCEPAIRPQAPFENVRHCHLTCILHSVQLLIMRLLTVIIETCIYPFVCYLYLAIV